MGMGVTNILAPEACLECSTSKLGTVSDSVGSVISSVGNGAGSVLGSIKDLTTWLGREVVLLASRGVDLAQTVALKLLTLIQACWELSKPWLHRIVDFVKSNAGIMSLAVAGSVLLGALALKLDDHPAQVALLVLSYAVGFFAMWYGCSTGVIPLLA